MEQELLILLGLLELQMFNCSFNTIFFTSVLLVEETNVSTEKHISATRHQEIMCRIYNLCVGIDFSGDMHMRILF
jgi:hypothetical protein